MRLLGTVMMAAIGASAWAGETGEPQVSSVTVCMDKGGPGVDSSAQMIASKVFGTIALKIKWVDDGSCPSSLDAIKVRLSHETPENPLPAALAYALPFNGTHFEGAHVVVFWDRIKRRGRSVSPHSYARLSRFVLSIREAHPAPHRPCCLWRSR